MAMEEVEVPVPTEKLSTDSNMDGGRQGDVVLVATGSFNLPPTCTELAKDELQQRG